MGVADLPNVIPHGLNVLEYPPRLRLLSIKQGANHWLAE